MKFTSLGGSSVSPGSCGIVEAGDALLMVDCGFVGGKDPESCAYLDRIESVSRDFGRAPDAIFITHGHSDHLRLLSLFTGEDAGIPVYATAQTAELAGVSGALRNGSGRAPVSRAEMKRAVGSIRSLDYGEPVKVKGAEILLEDAGHIPGSSQVRIGAEGKSLRISGDINDRTSFYLPGRSFGGVLDVSPAERKDDCLVVEATKGDTLLPSLDESYAALDSILAEIAAKGERAVIPAFAIRKQQEVASGVWSLLLEHEEDLVFDGYQLVLGSPAGLKVARKCYPDLYALLDGDESGRVVIRRGSKYSTTVSFEAPGKDGAVKRGRCYAYSKEVPEKCFLIVASSDSQKIDGRMTAYMNLAEDDPSLGWNVIRTSSYMPDERSREQFGRLKEAGRGHEAIFSGHADKAGLEKYVKAHLEPEGALIIAHAGGASAAEGLRDSLAAQGYRNITIPEAGKPVEF